MLAPVENYPIRRLPEGYQVDFNHDGIQEVGAAKTITFPPLDAPEQVKQAWLAATQNMDEGDMMAYQLQMHTMLYWININDQTSKALVPTGQSNRQLPRRGR